MSKRPFDTNQSKMTRNDRFAQMSFQEKLIEQKKREIQAKLEAKRRQGNQETREKEATPTEKINSESSTPSKDTQDHNKAGINLFSNDGSFLDQFKQMKDKKSESKFKAFNKFKDRERMREKEKEVSRDKNNDKNRWFNSRRRSPSPLDRQKKSRFSSERTNFELQKITINTSFSNTNTFSSNFSQTGHMNPNQQNFDSPSPSLLGPHPSTLQTPEISISGSSTMPTNTFTHQTLNFTPPPTINTLLPGNPIQTTTNTQLVTQQIAPSLQPVIQQTIGIAQNQQNMVQTPEQLTANLAGAVSALQSPQSIITQTLAPPNTIFSTTNGTEQIIQTPPQVLMNIPPPQIIPQTQLVLTPQTQNVLVSAPASILTTVTLPPPVIAPQSINVSSQNSIARASVIPSVELTSIPPPNPIQVRSFSIMVQNIPQPEPLNTLNIPPPAPLQVQNIPTPASLQLNEIPNPKPLDLMAIPTPNEGNDKMTVSDPDFIKNIPPPNKSIPPPNITEVSTAVPPPNTLIQAGFLNSNQAQGILVHNLAQPAGQVTSLQVTGPSNLPSLSQAGQSSTAHIPSLMSQPVLPPPGMTVNVPPPSLLPPRDVSQPPPNFVNQAPPLLPNMNMPPPMIGNAAGVPPAFKEQITGGAEFEAMAALARMVADCGPSVEDVVRQKKNRDPNLWFLFHRESPAYRQYLGLVEQCKRKNEEKSVQDEAEKQESEMYEPEMALEDDDDQLDEKKVEIKEENNKNDNDRGDCNKTRKRRSRWGDKDPNIKPPGVIPMVVSNMNQLPPVSGAASMLCKVTRTDPGLLRYVVQAYGTANLTDEDWKKAQDNYKVHLLYQDMLKKREELERLRAQGKNKYEYDSDEDTDGGTWEHKLREKEMQATEKWATELTRQAEGKHHIGDFLPPEELKRFLEKSNALKEGRQPNFSDYKEFKIKEDNIGFKMLQRLGWTEGQGLGQHNAGIIEPINKGAPRENTQGLGLNISDATEGEDEYESYRKRMMLAYRFRPNPMNNPRRPYY
ncbi:uncharacterized protein LOC143195269 isoform X2 [Rhynchophorus ferrugineus]|uniref:uncharacterized protein LOC143195269 isoform X2 n=1 Tax=Rhynchophorus ferrugineus TaxID=354439 RepID=UPI003FCE62BA